MAVTDRPTAWVVVQADEYTEPAQARAARMINTRIPRTRWPYLVYGGITAELAIQAQ
jgi:hypothetical protein